MGTRDFHTGSCGVWADVYCEANMIDFNTSQIANDIAFGTDPEWDQWTSHDSPETCRHMLASQIQEALDDLVGVIRRLADLQGVSEIPAPPTDNPRQMTFWSED